MVQMTFASRRPHHTDLGHTDLLKKCIVQIGAPAVISCFMNPMNYSYDVE